MKMYFSLMVFLCASSGIVSALKCYQCKSVTDCLDPIKVDKLEELDCSASQGGTSKNVSVGVSKENSSTAEGTGVGSLVERAVEVDLGCIKSEYAVEGKDQIFRGCGSKNCTVLKKERKAASCHFCTTDKCNSSVRIIPIEWIVLLIAMIGVGLEN